MPEASTGPLDWLDRYVSACAHLPWELIVRVSFITQSSTNAYLSVSVFLHRDLSSPLRASVPHSTRS